MFRQITHATRAALIACAALLPASVGHAATFDGAFWDADRSFGSIGDALAYIDGRAADATFRSTAIDYPNAGGSITSNTRLSDFLGATDGATLSGAADNTLAKSVFRFAGTVDLAGMQEISVGSDDGFALSLNGVTVLSHSAPRSFQYTKGDFSFGGKTTFELTYYENYGNTGVEFRIGDAIVGSGMAAATPAAVPLPAALPLLGAGVAALAGLRRLRRG